MADVQPVEDDNIPVNQPPTTVDPVIVLEPIPRDPPTPRLDNVTGTHNVTNVTEEFATQRDQSLENAIRPNQDEEDTSPIVRVGKIAMSTFQAIKSHSPFSNKPKGTVTRPDTQSPTPPPFADTDISLLTKDSSIHGVTQTLANELDNITVIRKSNSDESNNKPEGIDLKQIQKRLEYLTGGDTEPTPNADELQQLKTDVGILCQSREAMEDNLSAARLECNKLRAKHETLTRDATHLRDLLVEAKEINGNQRATYYIKLKNKDDVIDKLQWQIDALARANANLRSKYHDVTTEHLEVKQENWHITQIMSNMLDRNDILQRELDNCLESNLNNSKEMKIICQCECKCKCSKKKRKRCRDDDNDTDDHDDANASDDSDDDDNDEQLTYDADDQYIPERKLTAKQQKAQSKDTAYTVKYLNRYAYEKKGSVALFDTHGNTAKTRASFHVFMENLREILKPMYGLNDLLAEYPDLNLSTITHTKDKALGTFVKNKLSEFTKAAVEGSIDHFRSGKQILIYLQKQFGKQNALEVKTARDNLNTKGMQSGESIQNYGFRFLKLIQQYKKCAKASGIAYNVIHNNEYIDIFLTHLLHGINQTHALYNNMLSEHKKHQVRVREDRDAAMEGVDVMSIVIELSAEEEIVKGSETKARTANNTTSTSTDSEKYISYKYKGMKCLNCGQTRHKLSECKRPIDPEQRKALMDNQRSIAKQANWYKGKPTATKQSKPQSGSNNTRSESKTTNKESSTKAKVEANTVVMRSNAKPLTGTGFAGLAQVTHCHMAQRQQLSTEETNHVIVPPTDRRDYTNISSWLIDCGCSQHMTPVCEDLIQWEECDALVSMANGAVVHVKHCGSVKICHNDINDPRNTKFVQIKKALYVPGLNRRLLSVVQWNDAGGEILFLRDHCRIILTDDVIDTSYSIDVDSPFAADMPFTGNAEPQPADNQNIQHSEEQDY
jgi:hypothetical protein